jgi:hypothetical protein
MISGKNPTSAVEPCAAIATGPVQLEGEPKDRNCTAAFHELAEGERARAIEHPREVPAVFQERTDIYAPMPKTTFQEVTGIKLEMGKEYKIHFRVIGVGGSWTRHTETEFAAAQNAIRLIYSKTNPARLQAHKVYNLVIDYVTSKQRFIVRNAQGQQIRILKDELMSIGLGDASRPRGEKPVLEFGVKNLSTHESQTERYYASVFFDNRSRSYKTYLPLLLKPGVKLGDTLEIQYVERLTITGFVERFNRHKAKNLENLTLDSCQEGLVMRVDQKDMRLLKPRLSTFRLQACLTAEVERTEKRIRFWFDGESTRMCILSNYPVSSLNSTNSGLNVSYRSSRLKTWTFQIGTTKFDIGPFLDDFGLVSVPEFEGDSYTFKVSQEFRKYVSSRLDAASSRINPCYERGEISEGLQRHLLSKLGEWKEVEYHPFDKVWRTHECKKNGPDSIQRSNLCGKLAYFEFKWSVDSYQAYNGSQNKH